jgi:hypothetical protein
MEVCECVGFHMFLSLQYEYNISFVNDIYGSSWCGDAHECMQLT